MIHFTPTLGIKETAQNSNNFIKDNMQTVWEIFKPFVPYVIALYVIDIVITQYLMPIGSNTGEPYEFPIGSIIAGYFFSCLAITWHRVVIHGADKFEAMRPFNPKKSELAFIFMGVALFTAIFFGSFIFGFLVALINPILMLLIIPFAVFATYAWIKFMFYFPAKATGSNITLKQSFAMTTGYVWKMTASSFVAYLKLFLIMLAYIIVGLTIMGALAFASASIGIDKRLAATILNILFTVPIIAFFQPLFAVVWVTVLSNYYQYVLQNEAPLSNRSAND